MESFRHLSAVEQLAEYLKSLIDRGELSGSMPGVDRLSTSLGCSHRTVIGAMKQLEHEGLLLKQGPGRASKINNQGRNADTGLKIQFILYDREDSEKDVVSRFLTMIRRQVMDAGHTMTFASKTLRQLGMDVKKVAKYVDETEADAWVVASASREVLDWFSTQPAPAFALFGRRRGLDIAATGPDKEGAFRDAVRRLLGLGHRRIVLLVRPARRLPEPGLPEQAFLDELKAAGVQVGAYNLPAWDGSVEGLDKVLDSTFRLTPPTAMIIDEPQIFISAQHHLARRGIFAPEQVSLICADQDTFFDYMQPTVAHIRYDAEPWARRIAKWANHVAAGEDDRRQTLTKTQFVAGETIAPLGGGK